MSRLPCCICGSKNVTALVLYTHPMCNDCFHEWEKINEMPDSPHKRDEIRHYKKLLRKRKEEE